MKAIGMNYLTYVDLGNHNAGEGGSQLSDLKKYGNKPYISGQAYRHSIKDALKAIVDDLSTVDCTPRNACGDIENCKLCDLFGYMNTDLEPDDGEPNPNRVSPLRVSPLVGQYDMPITTDLVVQYDVEGDNRMARREIEENVFKGGIALDLDSIGRRENEEVNTDRDYDEQYHRELENEIDEDERKERAKELIDAVQNSTQLAGQARHMADFMPDLLVVSSQDQYNQRVSNALHVDPESGELNTKSFESVLQDLTNMESDGEGKVWVAGTYNPEVISNWDEVMETAEEIEGVTIVDTVSGCYEAVKEEIDSEL
ncbi:type I-B CRISPR-associated protein Cas7/Cst2/DevR [Halorutilales archaeon Cl-col2-1]